MEFERIDGQTLLPRLPHRETRVGEMRPPPAEPSLTSGGHKKSVIAVAPAMLVTAYPLLARQTTYRTRGPTTTTAAMLSAFAAARSKRWNGAATSASSNPRPEREVNSTGDFLSSPFSVEACLTRGSSHGVCLVSVLGELTSSAVSGTPRWQIGGGGAGG